MKSKSRIAYLIQDFMVGGIPTFLYNLSSELQDEFEFYFIATENRKINSAFNSIGEATYINSEKDITKFLIDKKIDIVQYGNKQSYLTSALNAKVPVIIERTAGPRSCGLNRNGVNHVISSTKGTIPLIRKNYSGGISTIYNGIDIGRVDSVNPNRLHFKDTDFIVCLVSRIGGVGQGIQYLIPAVIEARRVNSNIVLVIAGDRPNYCAEDIRPLLKNLAIPLGNNCVFTGELLDPLPIIAGSNLCCLPSLHHGISNFAIESCALKKPVVSTNVGQMKEIIHDGKNGYLIPPKNISSIRDKILFLSNSPKKCADFGRYGRQLVENEFNIKKQSVKYLELYKNLLNS